jgi:hypothetical protein
LNPDALSGASTSSRGGASEGAPRTGDRDVSPPAQRLSTALADAVCNPLCNAPDPVEVALAEGLAKATAAGEWAIVAQLAKELEARRLAGEQRTRGPAAPIADLAAERARRGR